MANFLSDKNLTYAIIGLGRFGGALATELAEKGCDLVIIDKNPEVVKKYSHLTQDAFIVDYVDKTSLKKIGIENCDVVIVCLADQVDVSILITLDLIDLNVKKVIARAKNEKHKVILEKLGAEVVFPEKDMAVRLATRLENIKTLDYITIAEKINIIKIVATEKSQGKTIQDLNVRQNFGCNILAIERGKVMYDDINPFLKIEKGDVIYVTGRTERLAKLFNNL